MYLYCITNKVSGRKYYGISVDYKQRWATHKSAAKHKRYKTPLYDAMNSYGVDCFELCVIDSGSPEQMAAKETELIASDATCYNLHKGGHIGFDVNTKGEQAAAAWKEKLRAARAGKKPALGMKHSQETKDLCGYYGKLRWDLYGRYPKEVTTYSFAVAKEKFGISKTHYYRLKRHSSNEAV